MLILERSKRISRCLEELYLPCSRQAVQCFSRAEEKSKEFSRIHQGFFAFGKVFKLNFASQVYKSSRMARFIDEFEFDEFEHWAKSKKAEM